MPLPTNASISDIINKLGELEGINQKTELATVIGAPASPSDNLATQITKLQNAKDVLAEKLDVPPSTSVMDMANLVTVGKRFATGTQTASGNPFNLTVSGLAFEPAIVIAEVQGISVRYYGVMLYTNGVLSRNLGMAISKTAVNITDVTPVFTSDGFTVRTSATNGDAVNWIAIE